MSRNSSVPTFFLYGEPPRGSTPRLVHVECLDTRSRPANWTIQQHAHQALAQLFLVTRGRGTMLADGQARSFEAPCMLVVPVGTIHGFSYDGEADGMVLTIGESSLGDIVERAPSLAPLFACPAVATRLATRDARRQLSLLRQLASELAWEAPGHQAAVESLITMALVQGLRALQAEHGPTNRADMRLVARFRQLIETRFRERPSMTACLRALDVSESQLRRACAAVTRRTPLQMFQERTILEARRMLLYSNASAAQIAYRLGFEDPAYFSRFFRAAAGMNVRDFRKAASFQTSVTPPGSRNQCAIVRHELSRDSDLSK